MASTLNFSGVDAFQSYSGDFANAYPPHIERFRQNFFEMVQHPYRYFEKAFLCKSQAYTSNGHHWLVTTYNPLLKKYMILRLWKQF